MPRHIATDDESHEALELFALLLRRVQREGYDGRVTITCHLQGGCVKKIEQEQVQVHRPLESRAA